ncbi:glycosyltransferase family 39 protein [bacterium]|nr:glycosyltransferase family 39 protein [bacterium]
MHQQAKTADAPIAPHPEDSAAGGDWMPRAGLGLAVVGALSALLFFYHLGAYGLWEPDESRYAEIAREMLASGNFIVPHLNYVPYVEKPPLLYWLTAIAMRLFGINEFAARFAGALAALAGVILTFGFARRVFDARRATLAGAILATSALYAVMAQVLTTDMLLTALTTAAVFALYLDWREGGYWRWWAYLAMALAVLTKGPVGAALPIAIGMIFLWREGTLRGAIRRYSVIPGALLVAALAGPWFIVMIFREPGYFDFYFIGEHFRRFFQPGYSHQEPIYYFVPVLLGGLLPWTFVLPFIAWRDLEPNPARRYCLIAAALIFVIFSLARAKLAPYILPAFPPLAVVLADGIATTIEKNKARRFWWIGPLLGCAALTAVAVALAASRFRAPYPVMVRPALYAAGVIFALGGIACASAFRFRRASMGLFALTATAAAAIIVIGYGRLLAEPARSYAALARTIERLEPNARLVCYPRYIQSLPFYCRRRVIVVNGWTELTFGAEHSSDEHQYFFTGRRDLIRLWNDPRPTVFVVDRKEIPTLRRIFGPWRIIAGDRKKIAIMRAASDASSGALSAEAHASRRAETPADGNK